MLTGLAHVCINASDLQEAEAFYCDALGFKRHFSFIRDGREFGFYLALPDGSYIEVFEEEGVSSPDKAVMKHICLETEDIDAFIATVRGKGIDITDKKVGGDKSWQAWLTGPDGVRIEIHQYTPESSQVTRADCVIE
jgi:glyoxylase I family protein